VRPAEADSEARVSTEAFTRGVAALRQYIAREGKTVVGRQHVEELPDGTSVRLGVFLSNQKNRRDRLTDDQLAALAHPVRLGVSESWRLASVTFRQRGAAVAGYSDGDSSISLL
jgi:hypothetical protein